MRRISSRATFFYKRVFPVFWFGFLAVFLGISLFSGRGLNQSDLMPFLIVPIVMMAFGYFLMKKFIFDVVDEVWDDGDALVVKNKNQSERITLADIKNVNYTVMVSPPRVTLLLRRPTIFGDQVTFCPPLRFVPSAAGPVINDLIERVDQARESRHRH
jgi:uncharacterized membrane protein YbhN (UPF0104 family)